MRTCLIVLLKCYWLLPPSSAFPVDVPEQSKQPQSTQTPSTYLGRSDKGKEVLVDDLTLLASQPFTHIQSSIHGFHDEHFRYARPPPNRNRGRLRKEELDDPIDYHSRPLNQREGESNESFERRKILQRNVLNWWKNKQKAVTVGVKDFKVQKELWQAFLRHRRTKINWQKSQNYWKNKKGVILVPQDQTEECEMSIEQQNRKSKAERQFLYRERKRLRDLMRIDPTNSAYIEQAINLKLDPQTLEIIKHSSQGKSSQGSATHSAENQESFEMSNFSLGARNALRSRIRYNRQKTIAQLMTNPDDKELQDKAFSLGLHPNTLKPLIRRGERGALPMWKMALLYDSGASSSAAPPAQGFERQAKRPREGRKQCAEVEHLLPPRKKQKLPDLNEVYKPGPNSPQ